MVSTPEGLTENRPLTVGTLGIINNPSARTLRGKYLTLLDVTQKTAVHRLVSAEENRKAMQTDSYVWYSIQKRRGHTKINESVKQALYNWVLHHTQAVKSKISNDCLKVSIYG